MNGGDHVCSAAVCILAFGPISGRRRKWFVLVCFHYVWFLVLILLKQEATEKTEKKFSRSHCLFLLNSFISSRVEKWSSNRPSCSRPSSRAPWLGRVLCRGGQWPAATASRRRFISFAEFLTRMSPSRQIIRRPRC